MSGHAHGESEWLTRKKRIDTRLEALGWQLLPFDTVLPGLAYQQHAIT
jgi:hypothetical protein